MYIYTQHIEGGKDLSVVLYSIYTQHIEGGKDLSVVLYIHNTSRGERIYQ